MYLNKVIITGLINKMLNANNNEVKVIYKNIDKLILEYDNHRFNIDYNNHIKQPYFIIDVKGEDIISIGKIKINTYNPIFDELHSNYILQNIAIAN